jgi:HNH/Endo VII superfamily nuclease toxin with a HHH motif
MAGAADARSKKQDKEFREWQRGSSQQAARYASIWAEVYLSSIASLTAAGDLVVTVSDIAEEGLSWQHLLIALPFVPHLPGAIRSVKLKFKGGRAVEIEGPLLQELRQLNTVEYELVTRPVATAQTPEEAIARIKHALVNRKNSPFQVHIDPHTRRGPMAIDTSKFKGGIPTRTGGFRDRRQFWREWNSRYGHTLSEANRVRIKNDLAPLVDDLWMKQFPEHSPYVGDILIHNHLSNGPFAIPVPDTAHRRQPGWGIWHQTN